jgi:hypothetical protein
MKLCFLPVFFTLIVTLAACQTNSKSSSLPASSASLTSPSPALPPSPVVSPQTSSSRLPVSPSTATNTELVSVIHNWYTYYSQEGNFTAKFPEKPEEEKNYSNTPEGPISAVEVRYVDKVNQRFYQTGYANLPIPTGAQREHFDIEKGLDGCRNGMVRGLGATVNIEKKISQSGSPGREITMTLEKGIAAKARIFINPKNLKAYQAIVVAPDDKLDIPEVKAFLDYVKISQ